MHSVGCRDKPARYNHTTSGLASLSLVHTIASSQYNRLSNLPTPNSEECGQHHLYHASNYSDWEKSRFGIWVNNSSLMPWEVIKVCSAQKMCGAPRSEVLC